MITIEKKDGIDVVVNSELPGWTRPASPDEVSLWGRIGRQEARVMYLERRLFECESAMLMAHDAGRAKYMNEYPEPIAAPVSELMELESQ